MTLYIGSMDSKSQSPTRLRVFTPDTQRLEVTLDVSIPYALAGLHSLHYERAHIYKRLNPLRACGSSLKPILSLSAKTMSQSPTRLRVFTVPFVILVRRGFPGMIARTSFFRRPPSPGRRRRHSRKSHNRFHSLLLCQSANRSSKAGIPNLFSEYVLPDALQGRQKEQLSVPVRPMTQRKQASSP